MSRSHPDPFNLVMVNSSDATGRSLLTPGSLWPRVLAQTHHALAVGALQSIPTDYTVVEQAGMPFLVRTLTNLVRKDQDQQRQAKKGPDFNPFLPYEPDLWVADLSDTHLCLLNKFNVVEHHLLMVTRAFEPQDHWLTLADFMALWLCLAEIDGLAFYNGGQPAGASQRHKHLQLIPLPLLPDGPAVPIAAAIATAQGTGVVKRSPLLPYGHGIVHCDPAWVGDAVQAATATLALYRTLLQAVGLITNPDDLGTQQTGAYNLLATRDWLMLIPRSQESLDAIAVNALGFAGALLVRTEAQLAHLKAIGPLTLLQSVAYP